MSWPCYGHSCYKVVSEKLAYAEAQAKYVSMTANLVEINSKIENDFIQQLSIGINAMKISFIFPFSYFFFAFVINIFIRSETFNSHVYV